MACCQTLQKNGPSPVSFAEEHCVHMLTPYQFRRACFLCPVPAWRSGSKFMSTLPSCKQSTLAGTTSAPYRQMK
eukprot:305690-Pelagomonas_calceolata.AAC.5